MSEIKTQTFLLHLAVHLYGDLLWLIIIHIHDIYSLIARFMGPTWGPSGADSTQVGPMNLAIWVNTVSNDRGHWYKCHKDYIPVCFVWPQGPIWRFLWRPLHTERYVAPGIGNTNTYNCFSTPENVLHVCCWVTKRSLPGHCPALTHWSLGD